MIRRLKLLSSNYKRLYDPVKVKTISQKYSFQACFDKCEKFQTGLKIFLKTKRISNWWKLYYASNKLWFECSAEDTAKRLVP